MRRLRFLSLAALAMLTLAPVSTATAAAPQAHAAPAQAAAPTHLYYLKDRPVAEGYVGGGLITINGQAYPRSIYMSAWAGSDNEAQYNLYRRCDRFEYVVGVTDDSTSVSVARFEVYGDNRRLKVIQLGFGRAVHQAVNVTHVLRLKVVVLGIKGNGYGGWGDASVRCTVLP